MLIYMHKRIKKITLRIPYFPVLLGFWALMTVKTILPTHKDTELWVPDKHLFKKQNWVIGFDGEALLMRQ